MFAVDLCQKKNCLRTQNSKNACIVCVKALSLQCVFHSIRFKVNKVGVQRYTFFYARMPHLYIMYANI